MLRWNQKINLTRIVDPAQIAVKHIVDSMAGLRVLPPRGRLLDVGSGAGYPGIVLKIMAPEMEVTLVDGRRKKIHFLKHALRKLKLDRITANHSRVEQLPSGQRHGFDLVVSRAVGDITDLAAMAYPFINRDTTLAAYAGVIDHASLMDCLKTLNAMVGTVDGDCRQWHLSVYAYQLPRSEAKRHMVIAKRRPPAAKVHFNALE
jgi:16S rRNA (guanine527-N7)-methyltransferase